MGLSGGTCQYLLRATGPLLGLDESFVPSKLALIDNQVSDRTALVL